MYICTIYTESGTSEGWHPHAYPKQKGMATSTLKDMGMPTSILDEMAIYIYIFI